MDDAVARYGLGGLSRWVSAGMVAAMAALAGCGSGNNVTPIPTGSTTNGVAKNVYVVQQASGTTGTILQFTATSNGAAYPTETLSPPGLSIASVFVDTVGQVYAGGTILGAAANTGEIEVFATGSTTLNRTISSGASTFSSSFYAPSGVWVDSLGLLYVAGQNASVSVFAPAATGAATPYRFIQGSLTQITNPTGIAVDGSGNIYVANGTATTGSVLVFGPSATGNVAPTRVITGTNTTPLINPTGISLDASGNLYVLNNTAAGGPSTIVEFAAGASSGAAPVKTIGGSVTGLANAVGVAIDAVGNVYVENETVAGGVTAGSVLVFGPTETGNLAPASQFTSTSWTAPVAGGIAVF